MLIMHYQRKSVELNNSYKQTLALCIHAMCCCHRSYICLISPHVPLQNTPPPTLRYSERLVGQPSSCTCFCHSFLSSVCLIKSNSRRSPLEAVCFVSRMSKARLSGSLGELFPAGPHPLAKLYTGRGREGQRERERERERERARERENSLSPLHRMPHMGPLLSGSAECVSCQCWSLLLLLPPCPTRTHGGRDCEESR